MEGGGLPDCRAVPLHRPPAAPFLTIGVFRAKQRDPAVTARVRQQFSFDPGPAAMLADRLRDCLAYLRSDRFAGTAGARGLGLLGMGSLMLAMGAASAGMTLHRRLAWTRVDGTVDRCERTDLEDRRGNRIAVWRLWYRYTFGGRQIVASEMVDASLLRRVETGQPIAVYVDRRETTRSTSALGIEHTMQFARHLATAANGLAAAGVAVMLPAFLRAPAVESAGSRAEFALRALPAAA